MDSTTISQPNPNDSFSFNWLTNIKPSTIDTITMATTTLNESLRFSFDALETGSFIDMDPKLISMRWSSTSSDSHHFDFNLPTPAILSDYPESVLLNRSLSLDSSKSLLSQSNHQVHDQYLHATPSRTTSTNTKHINNNNNNLQAKSRKKLLICKYLCFLMPLFNKVKCLRFMAIARSARIYTDHSVDTSPRTSNVYTTMLDLRSESIHDAVLYCKNSNMINK